MIEFSNFKIGGDLPAEAVNLFIGSYICMTFKMLAEKLIEFRDKEKGDKKKVENVTKGVEKLKVN